MKPILWVLMVKKIKYFALCSACLLLLTSFMHPGRGAINGLKIIVIDPGHGGKDPGCNGASHNEKDVALAVGLRLGKLLEENLKDVKVIYTRTTDVFVELEDRAQIANKAKADLFISIHCNAAGKPVMVKDPKTGKKRPKTFRNKKGKLIVVEKPNPVPFGTETYVMGLKNEEGKMKVATRENSAIFYEEDYEKKYGGFDPESEESYIIMSNYTTAYVIQSASLAMKIQEEYTSKAGRINKGVHRQSIWVLWRTSMPSILTELGYLTNPLEEKFLASEKGQDYLAKAIFRGVRRYKDEVEGKKKDYDDEFENQTPLENENLLAGNIPGKKKADDEDEEEQKPIEVEKKELHVDSAKSTAEKPKEPENQPQKQKVRDDAYVDIELKTYDSTARVAALTEDTIYNARHIAEKLRKTKEKAHTPPAGKSEEPPASPHSTSEIVFKVQFASSDSPLDLDGKKYAAIKQSAYYKMKNVYKYTSGSFSQVKDAMRHQNELREKGFKDCFVIAMKNGERMDLLEARKITGQ